MRPFDTFAYVGDSLATACFLAENGHRMWSEPWALRGFIHPAGAAHLDGEEVAATGLRLVAGAGPPLLRWLASWGG